MVKVTFTEYLTIYTKSFIICFILSILVYIVYPESSMFYAILASAIYLALFAIMILKTSDGREIVEAMNSMKVPQKLIVIAEKVCRK